MTQQDLDTLASKYKGNAMCLLMLSDLRVLLEQEKMQHEILDDLKDQIKCLKAALTA